MTARGLGLLGRWLLTGHPLGCTCADCAEIDRGATGLVAALGDAADRAGGATAPTPAPSTPPPQTPRAPPQTPRLTPARSAAVRPPIVDAEIIEDVPAPPKRRLRQLGAGASTPTTIPRQKRRRG